MQANLRHLFVFREVASRKSISAAARCVYLSQPAVTQAVASIERYFGLPLFNRSSIGMTLTEAGSVCAERISRALGQVLDGIAELSRSTLRDGREQRVGLERVPTSVQLRALVAVVEHGSFSRAARAVRASQPTIHRAARDLEGLLDAVLFERTSFGVQPTREAEKLARRFKLAFAEISQARAEVNALRGGESGTTVIGTMPLARSFLVPRTLIEFTAEYPDHAVSIQEGSYESLVAALRTGGIDFLVGALRDPLGYEDLVQEHLFDDPLAIIMRAGHPLAGGKRASVQTLAKFPWVAPRVGSPLRAHFDALFAAAGVDPPHCPIECNSLVAIRALLLESDRLALLSEHQARYEIAARLLSALPHPKGKVVRPIGLTRRRDWRPTVSQRRLLELLRPQARSSVTASAATIQTASRKRTRRET